MPAKATHNLMPKISIKMGKKLKLKKLHEYMQLLHCSQ